MQISINQISTGKGLLINGEVYMVTEFNHVKPGKGSAFVRVRLKNLKTDLTLERTFRSADKLEEVFLEEKTLQYTYRVGESFHFLDQSNYEEMEMSSRHLGENNIRFFQDNIEVSAVFYNNQIQRVYLPNFIIANIVETEPGFKGDSSRAGTKPAKIDTGAMVQVPLFIGKGEWVKIDTRDGQYVERVQK